MIKEITYNGITANPSDYEVADGDLAMAIGAVPEDGSIKPIMQPAEVYDAGNMHKVIYIHQTYYTKNYIVLFGGRIIYYDKAEESSNNITDDKYVGTFNNGINQVTSVGNTLIVLTNDGMHYFLWKGDDEGYLSLGTHLPECHISFGLQGEAIEYNFTIENLDIHKNGLSTGYDGWRDLRDNNATLVNDAVMAQVNKFIADESTNKGRFLFPFFVRYAYRLYDSTLTMHSAPILMIAADNIAPWCYVKTYYEETTGEPNNYPIIKSIYAGILGVLHNLDYELINELEGMEVWEDIIHSVDIFISKPIYTYDQNGKCERIGFSDDYNTKTVCLHTNQVWPEDMGYYKRYQSHYIKSIYSKTFQPVGIFNQPADTFELPARVKKDIEDDIKSCAQFYFLKSIPINKLKKERTIIEVEEGYLKSLVNKEVMTDDYDSHDTLIPRYAFNYNSRINIANLKKKLYNSFNPASNFCFTNGHVAYNPLALYGTYTYGILLFIRQDEKEFIISTYTLNENFDLAYNHPFIYFYYPNVNAYKAIIFGRDNTGIKVAYEIPLKQHDFLNGAFYFNGFDTPNTIPTGLDTTISQDLTVNLPNKIYTSEVNNPFLFPVLGINTVGAGEIRGISSATKSLSEGQFGQFPLYAFTDEGVWAMEVSNTGTYSTKQAVTRDVCNNPQSITQIDTAVLFATDRGIMLISGSQTQCITDIINTPQLFSIDNLPRHEAIVSIYNSMSQVDDLTIQEITPIPFLQFIKTCRIIYDYTHQHIIIYNPNQRYAYLYSLKSKQWGMMRSYITNNVNSYPEALAMSKRENQSPKLVNFSIPATTEETTLIITRPFKMDDPNVHKTIDTIIQRGNFQPQNIKQILYGSNDLNHWQPIWSSVDSHMRGFRGTPYKYFRLAIISHLHNNESIRGCTLQYTPRLTNKPR